MKPYTPRHTLAILRRIIGLTQSELAVILGRSPRTIQAIEGGRLTLSDELALRVSHETGVSMRWLLALNSSEPPTMEFGGLPFTKAVYDDTRASILAGKNPNLFEINVMQDGIDLDAGPLPLMRQAFDQINSLKHPSMDYWLVSLLSAIFAGVKAGRARLAIYRFSEFIEAMHKEFGRQIDKEFTNDATIVFEEALMRVKLAEFLVDKRGAGFSMGLPDKEGTQKNVLQDTQSGQGLDEMDQESLRADLNKVGDRIKARQIASLLSSKALSEKMRQVFSASKSVESKANRRANSKARAQKTSVNS